MFVGVQPTFGYEGDPMRLLYSRSASPHHGFAAYYTYLEKVWGADAVLHFGTHGSLEFMPGKQMGMSETCYPDSLIGALPNLYYYAANNPSEATIAKRRGYASTISYLTPPAENAGLYKGLKELGELVGSYQQLRESSRGVQIVNAIVETARLCNLDKDVTLPEVDGSELDQDGRDAVVGAVYRQLMEIESRLLPCGLHTIGKPPTAEEAIATLVNIAALEREEEGLRSLPGLLAESRGRTIADVYKGNDAGVLADVELNQLITETSRAAVGAMVKEVTGSDGRVTLRRNFGWFFALLERFGFQFPSPGWRPAAAPASLRWIRPSWIKPSPTCVFASSRSAPTWRWRACCGPSTGNTCCRAPAAIRSAIPACCPAARTSTPSIPRRSPPAPPSPPPRWWWTA